MAVFLCIEDIRCYDAKWVNMPFKRFRSVAHKTFAGMMAIWLSGVVFLFCCEQINGRSMEEESCPLAKMSGHCDKADKNKDSQIVSNQSNEQGMDCCGFLPVFFDRARTIETNQQVAAVVPTTVVVEPKPAYIRVIVARQQSYRSIVLLRNSTYLKNRTFRI